MKFIVISIFHFENIFWKVYDIGNGMSMVFPSVYSFFHQILTGICLFKEVRVHIGNITNSTTKQGTL